MGGSTADFVKNEGKTHVAAQSELNHAGGTQFLVRLHNSGAPGEFELKIEPVIYCPSTSQVGNFSLHNSGEDNRGRLSEEWEGLVLVLPATSDDEDRRHGGKEYYLFAASGNNFVTQDGEFHVPHLSI